jgi:hypothetical protein
MGLNTVLKQQYINVDNICHMYGCLVLKSLEVYLCIAEHKSSWKYMYRLPIHKENLTLSEYMDLYHPDWSLALLLAICFNGHFKSKAKKAYNIDNIKI